MSYTKIYYDDIWEATSKSSAKCNEWLPELQALSESFANFVESESFKGEAATNMKNYLEQVHGILVAIIGTVIQSYSTLAVNYYGGYTRVVDTGDSDKYGLRYTTIVSSEVSETGSIQRKLNNIISMAEQVAADANSVKNSIADLVTIYSSPKTNNLYEQINAAKNKAQTVHNNAINFEASRANDFNEIDRLIEQALRIITAQTGTTRTPIIAYQSGSIGDMCDINQILVDLEATSDKVTEITEDGYFEEDAALVLNRDALIQEEEEASRQWVQWVAVGIAVVGSVVLIAVTAGGATPLVCAAVGAGVGAVTAASSQFADNYVDTGSFVEGMDWSEFGEDVFVGAVGGFVGGYLGAVSQGSAIKQPIEKAVFAMGNTVAEKSAEAVTSTIWELGETGVEVGMAIYDQKPGNEIMSVLDAGLEETRKDLSDGLKETVVEGTKSFVGGGISGKFDVDTSDKSVLRKIGEKTLENVGKEAAGGTVGTLWDMGEAVVDNDSSTTVESALKKGVKDTVSNMAGGATEAIVSEGLSDKVDNIKSTTGKVIAETATDTLADTTKNVTKGVTGRTMDYFYGDGSANEILDLENIWEEDLEGGRKIVESAGTSAGEHIVDEVFEDKKHYNEMKKIDKDGDGKIEVVRFGEHTVTKQDYDAAVENAGKGAYKDQTAQEILGLNRDTDLESGKHQTVDIDYTVKHSDDKPFTNTVTVEGEDGKKYVFTKEYYESTENAAGTKDYEGRKLREMLGVPEDTKLKDNITTDTVRTDSIGKGKDVELHQQSGTNATKIDISTTSRQEREKAEKAAKKIAKEFSKNVKNYKFKNE